jgi:hypothetical protein
MYAEDLREMAADLDAESGEMRVMRAELLEQAASVADQVEATARPGDGKDTAGEIGRRIRALMEEER